MEKHSVCVGLLAHVDAGKTTLSEAFLYRTGARRTLGRVDHGDAFLDTHSLERQRGITIFSKQALLETDHLRITLLDTPGHADFSAEAERVMPVLDCAVLIISATDGVQAHTVTLWKLLEQYNIPVFLFINKCDLPGISREVLLERLQKTFGAGFADFSDPAQIAEAAAMCDETLLEQYLESGAVTAENIRALIQSRKLFPCCFGAGLKLAGVDGFLDVLDTYAPRPQYGDTFGGRVYKISRDPQGNRLTWLKVTGGSLQVRQTLAYGELEEKAVQLRLYSGDKFTAAEQVFPGQCCAVTGLSATYIGQGLGCEKSAFAPRMQPVMTYRVVLPKGADPVGALQKLQLLQEEDPLLHIAWDNRLKQIQLQIMGGVQLEVLQSIIAQRFGMEVQLDTGRIFYKETIAAAVEGVGHFEPLRHYAEVHLLLEPLPQGSGLVFESACPTDILEGSYQNLVLTHLEEKTHLGVLTGSPITDMKITLTAGRAHVKHTEGGDFREATYRAVRQGLMQAQSVLLEPWYSFILTVPTACIGRAITDIRSMNGRFDNPEQEGDVSVLQGTVPAAQLGDYARQVAAYTQGKGVLQISLQGYAPCHDPEKVIGELAYDPESDVENTPDSVFCDHGAGVTVKWHKVPEYMHLESCLKPEKPPQLITRNLSMDDKELEAIMRRQFGQIKRPQYHAPENRPAAEKLTIRPPRQTALIVDGYNIIFAWDPLAETAKTDLDAARRQLCDWLQSYAGYKKCYLVVVFDGWRVKGNPGEKQLANNIHVVYTRENETADAYIEALAAQIGKNYAVKVATSDALVQLSSLRSGVLRMSARELWEELQSTNAEMKTHFMA